MWDVKWIRGLFVEMFCYGTAHLVYRLCVVISFLTIRLIWQQISESTFGSIDKWIFQIIEPSSVLAERGARIDKQIEYQTDVSCSN